MTKKKRKILVTSGRWQAALACVQSFGRAGHYVYLFDTDPLVPLGRSRYCCGVVPAPSEYDQSGYSEALLRELERQKYDALIPISDAVAENVAANQVEIRKRTALAIASHAAVKLSRNKASTCRFAEDLGILTPQTYYPSGNDEVRALSLEITYPCILKAPNTTGSKGVRLCQTPDDLMQAYVLFDAGDFPPIVQEYIPGDLYDTTVICDRGEVVAMFAFYSPLIYQVGGTPPYAYSFRSSELEDITRTLLRALDWHGPADLDFLRGADGRYYFLEINPRLSGTVNMSLKLGIDLPLVHLDIALGEKQSSYKQEYEENVLFRSILPTEMTWLLANIPNRIGVVLRQLLVRRACTNIYWSDLPYIAAELKEALSKLSKVKPGQQHINLSI